MRTLSNRFFGSFVFLFTALGLVAFFWNFQAPLQGTHTIRQSDTVFAAYSYCIEKSEFLKPKIAHRGLTEGVAIGEFPLYSYVLSLPCQIRGSWSEFDAKFLILFLWLLNLVLWPLWLKRRYPEIQLSPLQWYLLLAGSSFAIFYMSVSLPDNLAFALLGIAAHLNHQRKASLPSSLIFALTFAIRPYFIPFLILVEDRRRWQIFSLFLCTIFYFVWYKWWALKSDINYYYLAIPPVTETLGQLPHYFGSLTDTILREWFHYFFVLLVLWQWKRLKAFEILGGLASFLLVLIIRGEHIVVHSYYMWPAWFFALLCLARALSARSKIFKNTTLILYALIGISQTQHQFHRQSEARAAELQTLLEEKKVPPQAKIAVFVGEGSCSTQYLYWMKHLGWCIYEKEFKGPESCPEGADYYLRFSGDRPAIELCSH